MDIETQLLDIIKRLERIEARQMDQHQTQRLALIRKTVRAEAIQRNLATSTDDRAD